MKKNIVYLCTVSILLLTLFTISVNATTTCIGDISVCSDLSESACPYFNSCGVTRCEGTKNCAGVSSESYCQALEGNGICVTDYACSGSLDCSTMNEQTCITANYLYNNCNPQNSYISNCIDLTTSPSCDSASSYGCFWDGFSCDAYDSSYGSCAQYNYGGETDCINNGCYYDISSDLCTKQINNNVFTNCQTTGSCNDVTDMNDCNVGYGGSGCYSGYNSCSDGANDCTYAGNYDMCNSVGCTYQTSGCGDINGGLVNNNCNQLNDYLGYCTALDTNSQCSQEASECWTQTGNVLFIPNRCIYFLLNGNYIFI